MAGTTTRRSGWERANERRRTSRAVQASNEQMITSARLARSKKIMDRADPDETEDCQLCPYSIVNGEWIKRWSTKPDGTVTYVHGDCARRLA